MDLLEGLEGIPDSQYRASVFKNIPLDARNSKSKERERLSWQGYSQDTRLLLDISNKLELLSHQVNALGGGKNHEMQFIDPPNAPDKPTGVAKAKPGMKPGEMVDWLRTAWEQSH